MKRSRRWLTPLTVAALVAAVAIGAWQMSARRAAAPAGPAPTVAVKAAPVLEFMPGDIVTAQTADLVRGLEVSGTVRAVNTAFVKARVAGEITAITVREGDAVRAGQAVVQQDAGDFDLRLRQADQQAAAARAQLEIAERALTNNKALVAQGFISPTALDTSVSNERAAQATLQAALAAVDLARRARADATLTAPIAGLVAQRLAQPGERVSVDARILEIVDLSRLELEASLTPEDVATVRVGSRARLRVDGIDAPIGARVARINPSAQAGSRAVSVYLALDTSPSLRQGLFARGRIELDVRKVLALPASAVRADRALPYVLALEGDKVVARNVRPGLRGEANGSADGRSAGAPPRPAAGEALVEIAEGLTPGAQVLSGRLGAVADGSAWRMSAPPKAGGGTLTAPASRPAADGTAAAASR